MSLEFIQFHSKTRLNMVKILFIVPPEWIAGLRFYSYFVDWLSGVIYKVQIPRQLSEYL